MTRSSLHDCSGYRGLRARVADLEDRVSAVEGRRLKQRLRLVADEPVGVAPVWAPLPRTPATSRIVRADAAQARPRPHPFTLAALVRAAAPPAYHRIADVVSGERDVSFQGVSLDRVA